MRNRLIIALLAFTLLASCDGGGHNPGTPKCVAVDGQPVACPTVWT